MASLTTNRTDDVDSLSLLTSLAYFCMDMGWEFYGISPMLDLTCLGGVLVWKLPIPHSGSIPRSSWFPNSVIPSYSTYFNRGGGHWWGLFGQSDSSAEFLH